MLAISFEVAGTSSMKLSHGLSRLAPSICVFFFYALSLTSLTYALRRIDISVAYATWSGLGTVVITLIGCYYFNEPLFTTKALCVALIVLGVVGLNLSGAH